MDNHDMLQGHEWKLFTKLGFYHPFWTLQADTLTSTFIIVFIIATTSLFINRCLKNKQSLVRFATLQYVQNFRDLLVQTLKAAPYNHLSFIGSLFTFILLCNSIQILPTLEEPTKDLNTTLALGLISFFYVQIYGIKTHGIKHYCMGYFEPFFFMFPLNVVGTLTSIISLSFRLFGNIFGGFIITALYTKMISGSVLFQSFALLSGLNLSMLFVFGLFEGLIQAFVFSMLTLTYLSIEIMSEDENESIDLNLPSEKKSHD